MDMGKVMLLVVPKEHPNDDPVEHGNDGHESSFRQ